MFGALGWGFGGSISYMQVISYTHSGHAPSQLYGLIGLFWIGFLWAGLGGAGTAFPAVADRQRLSELFKPLLWVFVVWTVLKFGEEPLARYYEKHVWDSAGHATSSLRQKGPFYWFDTDWLQAFCALIGLCLFDLWERIRGRRFRWLIEIPVFVLCPLAGGLLGWLGQTALQEYGYSASLAEILVVPQGDTTHFDVANLMTNWPQFFSDVVPYLGVSCGVLIGLAIYFAWFGQWRCGASLLLHMALGWFVVFLALPVLGPSLIRGSYLCVANLFAFTPSPTMFSLSNWGGLRLSPPRGDDWAGITGVFFGALIYFLRKDLRAVAYTALVSGFAGGVGFAGAACLKLMMVSAGNPNLVPGTEIDPSWAFWQSANWHSFLEQSYGLVNGLGIALALGLLSVRVPFFDSEEEQAGTRPWTQVFAVAFVVLLIPYVNLAKNVVVWVSEAKVVPEVMRVPLVGGWSAWLQFSASTWFNVTYILLSVAAVSLMIIHSRRPLALLPSSGLGRGQLLYLALLWVMVVGNFERALVGFTEQRMLTEWVIVVNTVLATLLVLLGPREDDMTIISDDYRYGVRDFAIMVASGVLICTWAVASMFYAVRLTYGDSFAGHAGYQGQAQTRFGDTPEWKIRPILKTEEHR
jgi:hypothetical protein